MNFVLLFTGFLLPFIFGMDAPPVQKPFVRNDLFTRSFLSAIQYNLANIPVLLNTLDDHGIYLERLEKRLKKLNHLKAPLLAPTADVVVEGFSFLHLVRLWRQKVASKEFDFEEQTLLKLICSTFGNVPEIRMLVVACGSDQLDAEFIEAVYNSHSMFRVIPTLVSLGATPLTYNIFLQTKIRNGFYLPTDLYRLFFDSLAHIDEYTERLILKSVGSVFNQQHFTYAIISNCSDNFVYLMLSGGFYPDDNNVCFALDRKRSPEILLAIISAMYKIDKRTVELGKKFGYDERVIQAMEKLLENPKSHADYLNYMFKKGHPFAHL